MLISARYCPKLFAYIINPFTPPSNVLEIGAVIIPYLTDKDIKAQSG